MVNQVWSQEETEEDLRKTKFMILTCSRNRRHVTKGHMGKIPGWSGSKSQKQGEGLGYHLYLGFWGTGKAVQMNSLVSVSMSNLRLWAL